jgi:hypothetical protein
MKQHEGNVVTAFPNNIATDHNILFCLPNHSVGELKQKGSEEQLECMLQFFVVKKKRVYRQLAIVMLQIVILLML